MAYICNDCSYRGISSGQAGQCPACGSFNLLVRNPNAEDEEGVPSKWRLRLVIGLWTILLLMIAWKLFN